MNAPPHSEDRRPFEPDRGQAAEWIPAQRTTSPNSIGYDVLDVTLADDELLAETELTVHLMIAANESDHPLDEQEIDHLLGLGAA